MNGLKKVLSSPNLFSIFDQILTRKLCATMALKTLVFVRNWWFYLIFNPCLNSEKKGEVTHYQAPVSCVPSLKV